MEHSLKMPAPNNETNQSFNKIDTRQTFNEINIHRPIILTGYTGTGRTFIIRNLIANANDNNQIINNVLNQNND